MYRSGIKRLIDTCVAGTLLILLSPVLVAVWFIVRAKLGSPALYAQIRPGLHERPFLIRKFRTMTDGRDAAGVLLSDGERLTPLGGFLRKSSLDELPELFNVLRGDMSLVGPRPLLNRYLPYYTEVERRRYSVRPGITGLAQVNGRNHVPWSERLAYDVKYVDSCSLWLDAQILCRTVMKVATGSGVEVVSNATLQDLDVERRHRLAVEHT